MIALDLIGLCCGGGWIHVYQQVRGIATLSRFLPYYLRPDWYVGSTLASSSTTCVSSP